MIPCNDCECCRYWQSQTAERRTNEDKRRAVEALLLDQELRKMSNRWIANRCKVSDGLVAKIRKEYEIKPGPRTAANGKTYRPRAQGRLSENSDS